MSEEKRIWFVYLTDHHEGPFLAEEIQEKLNSGIITGASLAWKDGMAEWQPLQSISELAISNQSPAVAAPEAPPLAVGGAEELSLAQQLAASQADAPATSPTPAPALSLVSGPQGSTENDPPENEEVWVLRNGAKVSGPYSFTQLKDLAKSSELLESFQLWRPGWTDFSPSQRFPVLVQLRSVAVTTVPSMATLQSQTNGGTSSGLSTLIKKTGASPARSGIAPAPSSAMDATDPGILRPKKASFLEKIKGLFAKKKTSPARSKATVVKKASGKKGALQRVAVYLGLVILLAGAGAYYKFFMMPPIPAMDDVTPETFDQMAAAIRSSDPGQIVIAVSQADLFNPKFYVASNLPEGTVITLAVDGVAGKLVNVIDFDSKKTAPVIGHLATFEPLAVDGKPIPMGEYIVTASASTGERLEKPLFLGGPKGPSYERRLKLYQEKLQQGYDAEISEMRELVNTLKGLRDDFERKLSEASSAADAGAKSTIWKAFGGSFTLVLSQLEAKVQPKVSSPEVFNTPIYSALNGIVKQLQALYSQEQAALDAGQPGTATANMPALSGILTAQEQAVAQAVTKKPVDALTARNAGGVASPTPPAGKP